MKSFPLRFASLWAWTLLASAPLVKANEPTGAAPAVNTAQQVLAQAASEQKYTVIMFYKDDSQAARGMAQTLKAEVAKRQEQVILTFVQIANPAEQAVVKRFDVSRAPMPLTMVVAHNGAITGVLAQKVTAETMEGSFVTPTMMRAMKSLQEGKLVLVCVQGSAKPIVPAAVKDFQADPHFKERLTTISFQSADPAEGKFLNQMQIDARSPATTTVLLAPPGVLVGKFGLTATSDDIAAALARAGKCCEDPNCKHNHHQPAQAAPRNRR